jgi:uncharacterized protein involved in outer membrane biogenesis
MRRFAIILIAVVTVLFIAALAVPHLLNVNRYHDRIQAEVQKRVGRPVSLGQMQLSLIPLAFRVRGATLADSPRAGAGKTFARADDLYIRIAGRALLRGRVEVHALELEKPHIELVRTADGVWNFADLGGQTAAAPNEKSQELALDRVQIHDGQVALTDLQNQKPRAVYDHIDLALTNYRPGRPFHIDVAAHLPGAGNQAVRLDATVGPVNDANRLATPIDGTLKLDQVAIASLQGFLATPALQGAGGLASGQTAVKTTDGTLTAQGSVRWDQPKLHGVDVGYPIAFDYEIADDLNAGLVRVSKGTLKLGATAVAIAGTVNAGAQPVQIDLHVQAPDAPIAEMARLAAAAGVAFDAHTKVDGRVQADVHARGAITQPQMSGTLAAKNLQVSGAALKQPVTISGVELALSPEAVRSNDFTVTTAGTAVTMQATVTQYATANPQIAAKLRANGADVDDLLGIARAYGIKAVEGTKGSGRLSIDVQATGPAKNAGAMSFSGTGTLTEVRVEMPTLGTPAAIHKADLRFSQNQATLQNLSGTLGSMNATGSATLHNFAAPQVDFTLAVDKLNLNELPTWFAAGRPAAPSLVPTAHAAEETLLAKAVGHGKATIGTVLYDQLVLNNVKSEATLDHGVIKLTPLTADVYGGTQSGSIVIDMRPNPVQYAVNTRMEKVDADKLISSTTSLKQILYGLLMANANATFRSGATSDQIARSLNGNITVDLRDGKIAKMDLGYAIANVGRFLSTGKKMQPFTNLVSLTGHFDVHDGVAQTNDMKLIIEGATLAATGAANLVDQTLDMRMVAVLSKEQSAAVGGTRVGGYMMTALADKNGQLVIPLVVNGTFLSPRFAPDVQRVAELKMQQTISDPLGTVGGLVGQLTGKTKVPAAQPQDSSGPLWKQLLDAAGHKHQEPASPSPSATVSPDGGPTPQP